MPQIEAAPAYENAHLISRDLLADISAQLDSAIRPDDPNLRWQHLRKMNRINTLLSDIADQLDDLNGRRR